MAAEIRVVAWGSPLATCCFELIFPQGRRVQLANTTTTTTTTATAQQRYNKLQQATTTNRRQRQQQRIKP